MDGRPLSFQGVLTDCRKRILAEPDGEWKTFELTVIDRWQRHAFANDAWETIDTAARRDSNKALWPGDLVEWVLDQARLFQRITDEIIPKSEVIEKKVIAAAEREWRATRASLGATSAGMKRDLAHEHRGNRIRVLGRQPNPRKRFILLCRDLFLMNCDQPLDSVTEMLVFVVFGSEPGNNEVRDALKPTTRRGRDTQRKK
jgi:hypothetical protein